MGTRSFSLRNNKIKHSGSRGHYTCSENNIFLVAAGFMPAEKITPLW